MYIVHQDINLRSTKDIIEMPSKEGKTVEIANFIVKEVLYVALNSNLQQSREKKK